MIATVVVNTALLVAAIALITAFVFEIEKIKLEQKQWSSDEELSRSSNYDELSQLGEESYSVDAKSDLMLIEQLERDNVSLKEENTKLRQSVNGQDQLIESHKRETSLLQEEKSKLEKQIKQLFIDNQLLTESKSLAFKGDKQNENISPSLSSRSSLEQGNSEHDQGRVARFSDQGIQTDIQHKDAFNFLLQSLKQEEKLLRNNTQYSSNKGNNNLKNHGLSTRLDNNSTVSSMTDNLRR